MTTKPFQMRRFTWILFTIVLLLLVLAILPQAFEIKGQFLAAANITVALLGLAAGLLVIKHMNYRLAHLAEVARALEQGDYTARADIVASDAIGLLARTINAMAEKIQAAIRKLEIQHNDLEHSKAMLAEKNAILEHEFNRQEAFGRYLASLNAVDVNSVAERTLDYMMEEADLQLGVFYLRDELTKNLTPIAQRGIDPDALMSMVSQSSQNGFPGQVANRRYWLSIRKIDRAALPTVQVGFAEASIQCIIGIPVIFQSDVLGVIVLAALHQIDDSTKRMLESAVDALGNALSSAMSYNTVQRQALQLEQANRELVEADRLRSEFVANMSHELRTPLNSVIGFSGLLQKNRQGSLTANDLSYAEKINRNGKHLLNLINDILDLSKIEAGRMDVSLRTVAIESIIGEVIDMLKPQADEKGIRLVSQIDRKLPLVRTDSEKLKRVLINLVGNAIKFTNQGHVKIRLLVNHKQGIQIDVEDTGIGIPKDKLEVIFQPFRQVDSSTTREYGGTGLGLAITESIVELMQGSITVSSEPERGSTFTVTLPLDQDNQENQRAASGNIEAASVEKSNAEPFQNKKEKSDGRPKILVVDDDPDARELLISHLESLGAEATSCENGEQALKVASEKEFDLITLDIMMPGLNGWEVLKLLKDNAKTSDIPVVIISIAADKRRAVVLGAMDALTKPISNDDLEALLHRHVRRRNIKKVLIIEDDHSAFQPLVSLLQEKVSEIRIASDGRHAMQILREFTPDLIFVDTEVPGEDQLVFLRNLRQNAKLLHLPVVVVGGNVSDQTEREELKKQASAIITKDASLEQQLQEVLNYVR